MSTFTDILTIAIPVYERKEFFEQALDSALNQSIKCSIIVVDNGSSHDEFLKTVQIKNNECIKYYRNNKNIGLYGNWNKCVAYTNTEFVMILGDDDILETDYVENFLNKYNENPKISLYYTDIYLLCDGEIKEHDFKIVNYGWKTGKEILQEGAVLGLSFPLISSCMRKKLFIDNYFVESPLMAADWLWVYSQLPNDILIYGNSDKKYYYRRHNQGISVTAEWYLMALGVIYIYEKLAMKLNDDFVTAAQKKSKQLLFRCIILQPEEMQKIFITKQEYNNFLSTYIEENVCSRYFLSRCFLKCQFFRTILKQLNYFKIYCKNNRNFFWKTFFVIGKKIIKF